MENLKLYIRSLLFDQDYVTVPNFGAFIANYVPADLNSVSGSLMPPQRKIAFNEILKQDDGLLTMYIARRQNLSLSEAQKVISQFVEQIHKELSRTKFYDFEDIGYFSLNGNNKLVFEPYHKSNFLGDSYGFDSIYPIKLKNSASNIIESNIEIEMLSSKVSAQKGNKNYFHQLLYALPVVLLMTGLATMIFINRNSDSKALASLNPFDYFKSSKATPEPKTEKVFQTAPIQSKVVIEKNVEDVTLSTTNENTETKAIEEEKTNTTNTSEFRFKVVAGIFKKKANAESLVKSLNTKGFEANYEQWNSFYRVVAINTNSEAEASKASTDLKNLIGENGVIIKK